MDIKLLKLKCGDLIIAKVTCRDIVISPNSEGHETMLTLEDPLLLTRQNISSWIMGDIQKVPIYTIPSSEVLLTCTPHRDLLLKYQEVLTEVKT